MSTHVCEVIASIGRRARAQRASPLVAHGHRHLLQRRVQGVCVLEGMCAWVDHLLEVSERIHARVFARAHTWTLDIIPPVHAKEKDFHEDRKAAVRIYVLLWLEERQVADG